MHFLITGGCGFIGSNFIRFLLQNSPKCIIVNLDALTYAGNPENLADIALDPRYHFVHGSITNYDLVSHLIDQHDITHIVNFAAESHVDRSILNPNIFIESNVNGTLTLLNAAKNHRDHVHKYIQISTDEVYGSLSFTDPAFTETTPLDPRSPYSASKASADMLTLAYFHTFQLPVCITRCSNNYGAFQFPEKLIPLMIRNIQLNKPLPVYGDGSNIRDWIHVNDHCRGIYSVIQKGIPGQVYNFGGHAEISNLQLVRMLLKSLRKGEELISFVKDRPGHDLRYAMDFSKATLDLNWQPTYSFPDGLRETIDWYVTHPDWVNHVITGEYLAYYNKQYGSR